MAGICALPFIDLVLLLAKKGIPPNRRYGYRVSHCHFGDGEIWYAINARGGVHTAFAEVFCAAYCALSLLFAGNPHIQAMLMSVFTLLLPGWAAFEIKRPVRDARSMARERGLLK